MYPVNPGRETVDGDPAYPSVAGLPEPPTVVNIVVPPQHTLEVLRECHAAGLRHVWLQPGAEDDAVLDYLGSNGFRAMTGACLMVATRPAG